MIAGFAIAGVYLPSMPRKPIELPPAVARGFVADMRAFHAEKNTIKADGIAARRYRTALKQHYSGKRRLTDIKEMFLQNEE